MATRLRTIVRFTAVPAAIPTALPHGLNTQGRARVPDILLVSADNFTVTADATNVTVTNNGTSAADCDVWCQFENSPARAYGAEGQASTTPAPFTPAIGRAPPLAEYGQGLTIDVWIASGLHAASSPNVLQPGAGSDDNDGLAPSRPLRTLEGLWTKFQKYAFGGARIRVHLAGGDVNQMATWGDDVVYKWTYGRVVGVPGQATVWVGGGASHFNSWTYAGPTGMPLKPGIVNQFNPNGDPVIEDLAWRINIAPNPNWSSGYTSGQSGLPGLGCFVQVKRGGVLRAFPTPISRNQSDALFIDWGNLPLTPVGDPGKLFLATDLAEIVENGAEFADPVVVVGVNPLHQIGGTPENGGAPLERQCTFTNIGFERLHCQNVNASFERCWFYLGLRVKNGAVTFRNCSIANDGAVFQCRVGGVAGVNTYETEYAGDPALLSQAPHNLTYGQDFIVHGNGLTCGDEDGPGWVFVRKAVSVFRNNGGAGQPGLFVRPLSLFSTQDQARGVSIRNITPFGSPALNGVGIICEVEASVHNGNLFVLGDAAAKALQVPGGASISMADYVDVAKWNGIFTRSHQQNRVAAEGVPNWPTSGYPIIHQRWSY